MRQKVNNASEKSVRNKSQMTHASRYLKCSDSVVYKVVFNFFHLRKIIHGTCREAAVLYHIKEHRFVTEILQSAGRLADHCALCACKLIFNETNDLADLSCKIAREILEAYFMSKMTREITLAHLLWSFKKQPSISWTTVRLSNTCNIEVRCA